jgi:hypothetical protein
VADIISVLCISKNQNACGRVHTGLTLRQVSPKQLENLFSKIIVIYLVTLLESVGELALLIKTNTETAGIY